MAAGLATGFAAGAVNGVLIAWLGLPPFVVTLGTLSIGRSLAVVLSQNKMIYDFGPDADTIFAIGGGQMLGIANPVWVLLALTVVFAAVLHLTRWGRHLYAIGGNEQAALLTGVPVARVKLAAYIVSATMAALAAVLIIGWQGSAINALGTGYELRVIASTVIGGANLMGGEGGAYGAFIGAALIEVIRNSLLMAGVDSNWQGTFVGVFIVLAVLLEKLRGRRRALTTRRKRHEEHIWQVRVALVLALAFAQQAAAADKKYVFALVPKNMNNPFFDQARDGCKKAEKELNGAVECLYIGPGEHGGGEEQVQVVNDLIARTRRWHRGVAVERAGDGPRAGRGEQGRHSGADLGFGSARSRQEASASLTSARTTTRSA